MTGPDLARGVDPGLTSSSLIDGVKSLQPAAWRKFTTIYGPLIYGWARRAGLHNEDAADIMQDVFRSVAAHAARLQHGRAGDSFRGWLRTITRNKLRDFWRSRAMQPQAAGGSDGQGLLNLIPENLSSDSGVDVAGDNGVLQRAVALVRTEFEQRSWEAFWRATIEKRAVCDVAEEFGMSANAIYVIRSRILRRLRELLAGDFSNEKC